MSQATSTTRAEPHRPILGAAVALFVALLGIASLKSYRDLEMARARQTQLEGRILETREGIEQLKGRIERLKSDPEILERLAREDLGLVYPDDVIIELPQPAVHAALPPPQPPTPAPSPPAAGLSTVH